MSLEEFRLPNFKISDLPNLISTNPSTIFFSTKFSPLLGDVGLKRIPLQANMSYASL